MTPEQVGNRVDLCRIHLANRWLCPEKTTMPLLSSFLKKAKGPVFDAPVAPDAPCFAIGDIHGDYASMEQILIKIDAVSQGEPVIAVGDFVDRGPRSADVLAWLYHLSKTYPDEFICLMGNHEAMLLAFLDDPAETGRRWLNHGGLQTLESYKIARRSDDTHEALRDQLAEAMGEDLIAWLRGLPAHWQSGNVVVTHAGANPALPIDAQPASNLIWGHPDFDTALREDGLWIVYGHRIVEEPSADRGRIAIDTGAYATQCLTAARVEPGNVAFMNSVQ